MRGSLVVALALAVGLALAAFACADIVGITDLPDGAVVLQDVVQTSDGPPPSTVCKNGTQIVTTNDDLSSLEAAGGRVFAQRSTTSVVSCATSTKCASPGPIVTAPIGQKLEAFTTSASIVYTLQGPGGLDAGSLHSVGLDGTNDQMLLQNLAYPYWVATSGTKTFWADDASSVTSNLVPATLHCVGCGGGDQPWITGLNATKAVFADANDVYVLADDGSNNFTYGIFGCSVNAPCGSSPRTVVLGGLDTSASTVASDGSKVYVARDDIPDLVSIDGSGATSTIVPNVNLSSIAVDSTKNELYFATSGGLVAFINTNGGNPSVVTNCDTTNIGSMVDIALDANSVYVLMSLYAGGSGVFAIPRP